MLFYNKYYQQPKFNSFSNEKHFQQIIITREITIKQKKNTLSAWRKKKYLKISSVAGIIGIFKIDTWAGLVGCQAHSSVNIYSKKY